MTDDNDRRRAEIETNLAKIRKTIAESNGIVSQVELRLAETDRLLASQGLTREQVLSMKVPSSQMDSINRELRRRGLDPIEDSEEDPWSAATAGGYSASSSYSADAELAERREKFGMMMKPFQI